MTTPPRRLAPLALSLALALAVAAAPAQATPIDRAAVRVIDGDNLRLASGVRVRLAGIDTADPPPRSACPREVRLALAAKARLLQLVAGAQALDLHRPAGETRDVDHYGRLLRDLSIDGRDAGEILIAEGLAQPWRGHKGAWCDDAQR